MATTRGVTGSLVTKATFAEKKPTVNNLDPLAVAISVAVSQTDKYTAGTGTLQADTVYGQETSISAPLTIDLSDAANTFGRVRFFFVTNNDPTNPITVYSAASGGWAHLPPTAEAFTVMPGGGTFAMGDMASTGSGVGFDVASSPAKVVIDPGVNTVSVGVLIVGTSVA